MGHLCLNITDILSTQPVNGVPDFYNLACTIVQPPNGAKCRAVTIQLGNALGGVFKPAKSVSTIIVPPADYQSIANHPRPFKLCFDYTLDADNNYVITSNLSYVVVSPSLLIDIRNDLYLMTIDAAEISERLEVLTGIVDSAETIQMAAALRRAEDTPEAYGHVAHLDSVMAPAMDAPVKIKQAK